MGMCCLRCSWQSCALWLCSPAELSPAPHTTCSPEGSVYTSLGWYPSIPTRSCPSVVPGGHTHPCCSLHEPEAPSAFHQEILPHGCRPRGLQCQGQTAHPETAFPAAQPAPLRPDSGFPGCPCCKWLDIYCKITLGPLSPPQLFPVHPHMLCALTFVSGYSSSWFSRFGWFGSVPAPCQTVRAVPEPDLPAPGPADIPAL